MLSLKELETKYPNSPYSQIELLYRLHVRYRYRLGEGEDTTEILNRIHKLTDHLDNTNKFEESNP